MKKYFGGSHLCKQRKTKRPLDFNKLTHLVLRLKDNQPAFFSPRDRELKKLFFSLANKHGVKIEGLIFNHSHVHAALAIRDRTSYHNFIRELTSKIVLSLSRMLGLRLKNIFQSRPFTRIVAWGRGIKILGQYLKKNEQESGVLQESGLRNFYRLSLFKTGSDYWASGVQLSFQPKLRIGISP